MKDTIFVPSIIIIWIGHTMLAGITCTLTNTNINISGLHLKILNLNVKF